MGILHKLISIYDRLNSVLSALAGVILVFAVLSVSAEVFMRYIFNAPIHWVVEINENNLLYITFLATAWVLSKDAHVKVELLTSRLGERSQNTLGAISSLLGLIICLIVTAYGIIVFFQDLKTMAFLPTTLRIPNIYILWAIPLGAFLLAIQFLRRVIDYSKKLRESLALLNHSGIGG